MTQSPHTPPHDPYNRPDAASVLGLFTTRDSPRLWVVRADGPDRVTLHSLRRWKLGLIGLLMLLYGLASLVHALAG